METPLHPALVHLPLGLAAVLPIAALGLALALWKGWLPPRAWVGVVVLQAMLVAGGAMALRTGEADEDRVERTVGEAAIEAHEHAAQRFVLAGGVTLAVAAAGLVFARKPALQRTAWAATAALSLGVLGLGLDVGHKGGTLVYRDGAAGAWTSAAPGAPPAASRAERGRDHDDD